MPDIVKMLSAGLADGNLAHGDAQVLHQLQGVGIGAVGGSEPGHGDAYDAFAGEREAIERPDGDEQGQRAVQAAADTHDQALAPRVLKAFCQSLSLDAENLFAALVEVLAGRYEWTCRDVAAQAGDGGGLHGSRLHHKGLHAASQLGGSRGKRGIHPSLGTQSFDIDFCGHKLRFHRVAFSLGQQCPVLVNECLAAEDHVLCALAESAGAEDITADAAGALLGEERAQVGILAYGIAVGTEVEYDVGSHQRELARGRHGCPYVLAQFDCEGTGGGAEQLAAA